MYRKKGELDLAIADFSRVIELDDPNQRDYAYLERGRAYMSQSKKAEAIADFQKVIELSPRSARH